MAMNRFERLRHYLSEKESRVLSANELARLLGVGTSTITTAENGSRPPSPKAAKALNEKYEISEEWYLTGRGYAPWEEREKSREEMEEHLAQIDKQIAPGHPVPASSKVAKAFFVAGHLAGSDKKELLDYFIAAGEDDDFRGAIYNVLETSGIAPALLELQKLKKELAELRAAAAESATVSLPAGTPGGGGYGNKSRPDLRMTADQTFESTEVILKFPEKPSGLDKDESGRWDRNELALRRWEKTDNSFNAPPWAVERFCRQVVHFYEGGNLHDIGGLLKDIIEEGKKT